MTPKFLTTCEAFQPAERACWEILLREHAAPHHMPVGDLQRAIGRSLTQLWSLLRAGSVAEWLRHTPPGPALTWLPKNCGLEELLRYFGAGQHALELIMGEVERTFPGLTGEQRERNAVQLKLAFSVLVQRELEILCGKCTRCETCTISGRPHGTAAVALPKRRKRRRRSKP